MTKDLDVISQIKITFAWNNKLSALVGFTLGSFVPIATYFISHYEWMNNDGAVNNYYSMFTLLVLGGLIYSITTVYGFVWKTLLSWYKAVGFVILIEGVMVISRQEWLSFWALGLLVLINGIGTAVNLVSGKVEKSND